MTSTDLFLIRHGESVPNVSPIIGGMKGDAGLTPRGREQAALLAARLKRESFRADRLYASTLPRALETAGYVSPVLGLPVVRDGELHELRPGEADGLSVDEWRARYCADGFNWPMSLHDPFRPFAPGGESWATFLTRAGSALMRLVKRHAGERIVAVCHGGVIEASFFLALGMGPTGNPVRFSPTNTGLTHWRYESGAPFPWTLAAFNDAAHLSLSGVGDASSQSVPTPAED